MKFLKKSDIPAHLREYVIEQQYDEYTPINHAVWRYVMRQNINFFHDVAHTAYTNGVSASGMEIERIPKVEEMHTSLQPFGWGAVAIDGYIPGVIFFDFQAHGLLPVGTDIRKLENIEYTPAPDIIHEAAGHAPILCDEKYAAYVKLFGEIGRKAIATKEEHEVFDAVRTLSNLLEKGSSTKQEIAEAEHILQEKQKAVKHLSEAEEISRLYWWTVEYGLIGDTKNPKIYGAGLLSSVGESSSCLSDEVDKIPFELEKVISTSFDITTKQPQLFVCEHFDQLIDAVKQYAERMAFNVGGTESLEKAIRSGAIATAEYSSSLQISGIFSKIIKDQNQEAIYLQTTSGTTLSHDHQLLHNHGKDVHADGFGSPIGKLKGIKKALEDLTDEELALHNIVIGHQSTLHFESGVKVEGLVHEVIKKNNKIVLIRLQNATVNFDDLELFKPEWGMYDMAVGECIKSVYAGAADPEAYFEVEDIEEIEDKKEISLSPLDQLYQKVRNIREGEYDNVIDGKRLLEIVNELDESFSNDWLLRLEVLELLSEHDTHQELQNKLRQDLTQLKIKDESLQNLIANGLKLV
ncbi:aromatic amino acid hydroxylase [Chengkuizengella axinellae]|uniref:Aromatic amino acid hydroxylase n=1 Tax=Chengkuizengella axinellae TaxID=3064388 RepID=A0ABT9J5J1_9BACL|nr:aromatic amino acid hydroxylase [Chengkuizengella sp. 2205SS18-9]MDP5276748.1 aromatic amino acid hydroxylase [Chengkuizengella sp. 2205SS18-9]